MRAKSGVADLAELRATGEGLGLGPVEAQRAGAPSDVILRAQRAAGRRTGQQTAIAKLRGAFGDTYEFRSVEAVGPRVSGELVQSGTLGVVVAILAVLAYLWFRFEWQFAVGAIIGTMHDLLLTVGFFCVTQLEFNQTSIAAILTIVGYSLNETVVVLDRIREVMRKYKRLSTADIVDMSVNAVLPRTIMTATTVFLALLALFFLGGHVIRSFSAAMIWGIFVATYSSIFICSPMLIYLGVRAERVRRAPSGRPMRRRPRRRPTARLRRKARGARVRRHGALPSFRPPRDRGLWGRRLPLRRHGRVGSILATPQRHLRGRVATLADLDAAALAPLFAELRPTRLASSSWSSALARPMAALRGAQESWRRRAFASNRCRRVRRAALQCPDRRGPTRRAALLVVAP